MINGTLGYWEVLPPPGLTDEGRIRRFQDRTVQRLQARANELSANTEQALISAVLANYREGEGTVASTIQRRVTATRDGISVEFTAGGRHLVFLTAMAGLPFKSPGHQIPQRGRSRFFWARPLHGLPPGMYSFTPEKPAMWKTRREGDPIADVLGAGAQAFTQAMIREHEAALVEFVQNDLAVATRSPRVNVAAGSGISP